MQISLKITHIQFKCKSKPRHANINNNKLFFQPCSFMLHVDSLRLYVFWLGWNDLCILWASTWFQKTNYIINKSTSLLHPLDWVGSVLSASSPSMVRNWQPDKPRLYTTSGHGALQTSHLMWTNSQTRLLRLWTLKKNHKTPQICYPSESEYTKQTVICQSDSLLHKVFCFNSCYK